MMKGNVKIFGVLTGFGALVVALYFVSTIASVAGQKDLANSIVGSAQMVLALVILGAVLSIAAKFR